MVNNRRHLQCNSRRNFLEQRRFRSFEGRIRRNARGRWKRGIEWLKSSKLLLFDCREQSKRWAVYLRYFTRKRLTCCTIFGRGTRNYVTRSWIYRRWRSRQVFRVSIIQLWIYFSQRNWWKSRMLTIFRRIKWMISHGCLRTCCWKTWTFLTWSSRSLWSKRSRDYSWTLRNKLLISRKLLQESRGRCLVGNCPS